MELPDWHYSELGAQNARCQWKGGGLGARALFLSSFDRREGADIAALLRTWNAFANKTAREGHRGGQLTSFKVTFGILEAVLEAEAEQTIPIGLPRL